MVCVRLGASSHPVNVYKTWALPADPQDPSGLGQAQLKVTQLGPIRTRLPDPMVPPSAEAEAQSLTGTHPILVSQGGGNKSQLWWLKTPIVLEF